MRYATGALFVLIAVMPVAACPPGSSSPRGTAPRKWPPSWFWGCWVVKKPLPITAMIGLSTKREKAIIGTRVVFTPACARSGNTVVRSPHYKVTVMSADEFWSLGRYPLSEIGIHKPQVTQVYLDLPDNLSDLDFPGNYVYLRKKDIVVDVENDALLAVRAKPRDPACTCSESGTLRKAHGKQ